MPALVSILIPSYNAGRWIRETIESALAQTWDNKEVIIVDDGSTDNTPQIAQSYESKLLKVISQPNRGANAARNRALEVAEGDYIQWLDADDLLSPDKISNQMLEGDKVANPRILLTSSWAKFYYRHASAKFVPDGLWCDLDPIDWLITKFSEHAWMNPAAWLVSRELTESAGPWDERLVRDQDGEYIARVVSNSEAVKFVSGARSYYRQSNQQSLSRQLSDKSLESILLAKSLSIGYLRSLEDSERTRRASLAHLQGLLHYLDPGRGAILERANTLVKDLGGELSFPARTWKYSVMEKLVGARVARHAQSTIATSKALILRNWDRFLRKVSPGPVR
jgi:glycosyltransferase involved in cell wall biosynthesis